MSHSAKGTTWANHKYLAIENGRYIYANPSGKRSRTAEIEDLTKNIENPDAKKKEEKQSDWEDVTIKLKVPKKLKQKATKMMNTGKRYVRRALTTLKYRTVAAINNLADTGQAYIDRVLKSLSK